MKRIDVIGYLGQDASLISIGEREYLSFSLATTERRNDVEKTTWFNCLSGNVKLKPYLEKGKRVYVSGGFEVEPYSNKEGIAQVKIKLFAEQIELL